MNAVTVGLGTLAGSVVGATPWLGTFSNGLWAGGGSFLGSLGIISGLPAAIPATSVGLVAGTLLSSLPAALEMTDVFIRDGLLWTLFSGAFSQLFNVTGNVFAGLV